MSYNGLTIADKDALMDVQAKGAEWVARDEDGELVGFPKKPRKHIWIDSTSSQWERTNKECESNGWVSLGFEEPLDFILWSDPEPVHVPSALAQIAEMEREQKPDGCEKCNRINCFNCQNVRLCYGAFSMKTGKCSARQFEYEPANYCRYCGKRLKAEE